MLERTTIRRHEGRTVNGKANDAGRLHEPLESVLPYRRLLGGRKNDGIVSLHRALLFLVRRAAAESNCRDANGFQRFNLVLHYRNQGTDHHRDNSHSFITQGNRRQLVN